MASYRLRVGAEPGPTWQPAAGEFKTISYAAGSHPSGSHGGAVIEELSPAYQSWNPSAPAVGPWGGVAPNTLYPWTTVNGYCGWAYSTDERKLIGMGSGHATVCVPVPWEYRLTDLTYAWTAIPIPSDAFTQLAGATADAATVAGTYSGSQFDTTNGEWLGGYSGYGALAQSGKIFPEMGHAYQGTLFIPGASYGNSTGAVLCVMHPTGNTIGSDMKGSHFFDMDTRTWVRTTNLHAQVGNATGGTCHDTVTNQVFYMGHTSSGARSSMSVMDVATKTWRTRTASNSIDLPIHGGGFRMHPPSGLILSFTPETGGGSASPTGTQWRVNAVSAAAVNGVGSFSWSTLTISAVSWPLSNAGNLEFAGMEYCPEDGCFYAINGIHGSTKMWKLAPPVGASTQSDYLSNTWNMTEVTMTTGSLYSKHANGSSNGLYVFNRLHWDIASRSFIWFGDWNQSPVQAIRPTGF